MVGLRKQEKVLDAVNDKGQQLLKFCSGKFSCYQCTLKRSVTTINMVKYKLFITSRPAALCDLFWQQNLLEFVKIHNGWLNGWGESHAVWMKDK